MKTMAKSTAAFYFRKITVLDVVPAHRLLLKGHSVWCEQAQACLQTNTMMGAYVHVCVDPLLK